MGVFHLVAQGLGNESAFKEEELKGPWHARMMKSNLLPGMNDHKR